MAAPDRQGTVSIRTMVGPAADYSCYCSVHAVTILDDPLLAEVNLRERMTYGHWRAGTVGFLPSGESVKISSVADISQHFLLIDDTLIREICEDHIDYSALDFHPANLTQHPAAAIARAARESILGENIQDWPLLAESLSVSLAASVVKAVSPGANMLNGPQYGLSLDRKRRVLSYIIEHMAKDISLGDLSSVAAMSRFHFARTFKATFGVTPMQAVMRARAATAKKLIRSTSRTLAEIALDCGYHSQSHMTTHFKKTYGLTPGAYRLVLK